MKAKVIATGEIVDVVEHKFTYYENGGDRKWNLNEIEIITETTSDIDWEQRRFELVKAARQKLSNYNTPEDCAEQVIKYADAVIAKLKEK